LRDALQQQHAALPASDTSDALASTEQRLSFERGLIRQMESDLVAKDERLRSLEDELEKIRRSRKGSGSDAFTTGEEKYN
jgi:hypothetical protein